jgi:hypothetical protein
MRTILSPIKAYRAARGGSRIVSVAGIDLREV